jgi:hypothetical protein
MRTLVCLTAVALLSTSCKRGPADDPRFAAAWKQLMARGDDVFVVGDEAAGAALLDSVHRSSRHRRQPDAQAPSAVPPPEASAGTQTVPDQDLMRVIRTGLGGLKQCYRLVEASTSDGGGKAIVRFTILPSGSVEGVTVDAPSFSESRLPSCVSTQVRGWRFPTFQGHPMEVAYPFVFVGG